VLGDSPVIVARNWLIVMNSPLTYFLDIWYANLARMSRGKIEAV